MVQASSWITKLTQTQVQQLTAPSVARQGLNLSLVCLVSLGLRSWAWLTEAGVPTLHQALQAAEQADFAVGVFGQLAATEPIASMGLPAIGSAIRGLQVLGFALALPGLTYLVGRRVASPLVGWVAAWLTAIAPILIDSSYVATLYVGVALLGLLGSWCLLNAVERSQRWAVAGWLGLRTLAIGCLPIMGVFLLSDVFIILWRHMGRPRRWFRFTLSGSLGIAAIALLSASVIQPVEVATTMPATRATALLPMMLMGVGTVVQTTLYWPLHELAVWTAPAHGESVPLVHVAGRSPILFYGGMGLVLMALMLIPITVAFRYARSSSLAWTVALAMFPIAGLLMLSAANQVVLSPRYWVVVAPYLMILMAYGWVQVWRRLRILAIAIAGSYLVAVGGGLVHYFGG